MTGFTMALAGLIALALPAQTLVPPPVVVSAGSALGECMVLKTTGADRLTVARWLLGSLASAPQVADVAVVQPARKEAADRAMAALFTRLITKDCTGEARATFAGGGTTAGFRVAGGALGRVAVEELLGNPAAQEAIAAYVKYLNLADFTALRPSK